MSVSRFVLRSANRSSRALSARCSLARCFTSSTPSFAEIPNQPASHYTPVKEKSAPLDGIPGDLHSTIDINATMGARDHVSTTMAANSPYPLGSSINSAGARTDSPPPAGFGSSRASVDPYPSTASNPAFEAGGYQAGSPPPPDSDGPSDPTVQRGFSATSTWLTGLLVVGLGVAAWGVGELYGSLTMWPKELRSDLRHGLAKDAKGDKSMAERYLTRAWDTARQLDTEKFGTDPHLKTTGIAIALAGIYESQGRMKKAYEIYQQALQFLQLQPSPTAAVTTSATPVEMQAPTTSGAPATTSDKVSSTTQNITQSQLRPNLTPRERMRAVALSYKLSELAELLHLPKEEEEKWLVHSVETVLRDVMSRETIAEAVVSSTDSEGRKSEAVDMVEQLKLPNWVLKHDLAAPFEALGTFYARAGRINYALPLYLQAIAILIPPPPEASSSDDQCRAAQLMGNISELIVRTSTSTPDMTPSHETLIQAESWAQKGVEVASKVRGSTFQTHPICEVAYAFGLFNLAVIREMLGDESQARLLFSKSLDQSKSIGLKEGIENSELAIKNLGGHLQSGVGIGIGDRNATGGTITGEGAIV